LKEGTLLKYSIRPGEAMPGSKQKCPASDALRKMSHRSLKKWRRNTEKI